MELQKKTKKRSRKPLIFLLAAIIIAASAWLGHQIFRDRAAPEIAISPDVHWVSGKTSFTVAVQDQGMGLEEMAVELVQGNRSVERLRKDFAEPKRSFTYALEPVGETLEDGPFSIRVTARDASWAGFCKGNAATAERSYRLDTVPPRISLLSTTHNLSQGGSGAVTYVVSEEVNSTGVRVGETLFPAYADGDGEQTCIFAQPPDVPPADFDPLIVAVDLAGNERTASLPHHSNARRFPRDDIRISDSFLNRKMRQFSHRYPGLSNLEVFLAVNRDLRQENRAKLREIGRQTASEPLWKGAFERMPGKTMATFGDRRDYKHGGTTVDHQTHLGVDIASTKRASVGASNSGRVLFTGFYGIYGNSVIIDHGQGLMTLYAHLSSVDVKDGQMVEKGQVVGRTGATGMAGGDHLHFGVLVSGQPVNPVEWWDETWIRYNIEPKLAP